MHSQRQYRIEQAILRLISDFPGLFGPVGIQLALTTLAGMPPAQTTRTGQLLVMLETRGLISRQDLGRGRFVYRLTSVALRQLAGRRATLAGERVPRSRSAVSPAAVSPV